MDEPINHVFRFLELIGITWKAKEIQWCIIVFKMLEKHS